MADSSKGYEVNSDAEETEMNKWKVIHFIRIAVTNMHTSIFSGQ